MPRFSVVIPAYNVAEYLQECIYSVTRQCFRDLELIVVDDASTDASCAISEECARVDERIRVVHVRQNQGLGSSRNLGISLATGMYVVLLDGDDVLAEGALASIAHRLAEAQDPDLLIYDYSIVHQSRHIQHRIRSSLLASCRSGVFTLGEHPELLQIRPVWNKAYRRNSLLGWGLKFTHGFYEDMPWSYSAYMCAQRIAALDQSCLFYRQRPGSILHTESIRHLEVFDQYVAIFEFIESRGTLVTWWRKIYESMKGHLLLLENTPGRIPEHAKGEFQKRRLKILERYRPHQFL